MKITLDKKTSDFLIKGMKKHCSKVGHQYQLLPDWMLKKYPEDKGKAFCTHCGREDLWLIVNIVYLLKKKWKNLIEKIGLVFVGLKYDLWKV